MQTTSSRRVSSPSPEPEPLRLTGAARRMQVLVETNALLAALGFGARSFEDYDDLVASVSSMSVALYEKLFQFQLEDIVRVPSTPEDYVHNAQLVVDALAGALLDETFDPAQLTGAALCDGDVASIRQLVGMFQQIYEILYSESPGSERVRDGVEQERERDEEEEEEEEELQVRREKTRDQKFENKKTPAGTKPRTQKTTSGKGARARDGNSTGRRVVGALTETQRVTKSRPIAGTAQSTIKKRTRRADATTTPTATGKTRQKEAILEQELLTTQRYGRYVPVPQRSRHDIDHKHDDPSDDGIELANKELAAGETYFGGVSSVSGASGSEASIHFMEEEGEFARNFSAIQSHSSPSKDSPETDSTPDRQTRSQNVTPTKSKNQQEAEDEAGTTSPVKKKLATARAALSPSKRPSAVQNGDLKNGSKPSLYPLLPETRRHDRTSAAHKEYLRYKIQLKDHLQELRQREYCQRQHLERAYRLGEHAANVERIRARRFEQELRLHRISIGLEAKTQEEKQLRDAMQHMLRLEKEKLRDEHKTTAQTLQQIQRDHAEREQSMETFYATQIQLVKEQTQRELKERETVEKAHRMASEHMIREMRRERERELAALLKEKEHLAQVRRFRHATQLTHAIEKGTDLSARQGDAFYAAAMKARQLRTTPSKLPATTSNKTDGSKRVKAVYSYRSQARRVRTAVRV